MVYVSLLIKELSPGVAIGGSQVPGAAFLFTVSVHNRLTVATFVKKEHYQHRFLQDAKQFLRNMSPADVKKATEMLTTRNFANSADMLTMLKEEYPAVFDEMQWARLRVEIRNRDDTQRLRLRDNM